jgi:hypothetical protein
LRSNNLGKKYSEKKRRLRLKKITYLLVFLYHNRVLTAAMEGLESSPGWGWVTSAPKIIVGTSLTRGILLVKASTSTVFRPPT